MSNNDIFDQAARGSSSSHEVKRRRKSTLLENRGNALSERSTGQLEDKVHRWVDPKVCRMWAHHNRRYDLLDQSRCQDLIDSFRAQGRQEFPAIVRKCDDGEYQYEVIAGARRHWTVSWLNDNNYPEFKFLIEVRDLTDEQAFRLSDVENRDKLDISDYERAVDYKSALGLYYKTQKEMAGRLEVSEGWLSRYLTLAELPAEVVASFGSIVDIKIQHGRELKPLIKGRQQRLALTKAAGDIQQMQREREQGGRKPLEGNQVVRLLRQGVEIASERKAAAGRSNADTSEYGLVRVTKRSAKAISLTINLDSEASTNDLLREVEAILSPRAEE